MNKTKSVTIFLVAAALFGGVVAQGESNKWVRQAKTTPKVLSVSKAPLNGIRRAAVPKESRQGYQLVTDVVNCFGGKSESDNYRIPVNSGGQPSAIGISERDAFEVQAGFVHASHVKRGDANSDGAIGAGDIVYLLNYLFRADDPPCPMESGDANCSGAVEAGDVVFLISYLYRGGPPPSC
jgi:hypothetical protein